MTTPAGVPLDELDFMRAIEQMPQDERSRVLRWALAKYPPPELVAFSSAIAKAKQAAAKANGAAAPALPAASALEPTTATGAASPAAEST